jgi:hypothetical protein
MEPSTDLIDGARYWQRRRRILWTAAAIAVLAALGIGIAIGGAFGSSSPGAPESLATSGIFHYSTESPVRTLSQVGGRMGLDSAMLVDLAGGSERPVTERIDYWYDPSRQLRYSERIVDGTRVGAGTDQVLAPGAIPERELALDELSTFGVHRVLASDEGTAGPTGTLFGRQVSWVRFGSSSIGYEVATDMKTGQPLAIRSLCARCVPSQPPQRLIDVGHVATLPEGLPASPTGIGSTLGLPGGGFSSRSNRTPLKLSAAAGALSGQIVYAGKAVGNLRLHSTRIVVTTTTLSNTNVQTHDRSVEFDYGTGPLAGDRVRTPLPVSADGALRYPPSVSIRETRTPNIGVGLYTVDGHVVALGPGVTAVPIPAQGQALLGLDIGPLTDLWLRRRGLYINIQATSPSLALQAARALRPVS